VNFGNDVLLILLLSILSAPTDEDGEVDFATNTNFLLLLLLILQTNRAVDSVNNSLCNSGCNCGCNSCNRCNSCSACNRLLG